MDQNEQVNRSIDRLEGTDEVEATILLLEISKIRPQPDEITSIKEVEHWHQLLADNISRNESLVCGSMSSGHAILLMLSTVCSETSMESADFDTDRVIEALKSMEGLPNWSDWNYGIHIENRFATVHTQQEGEHPDMETAVITYWAGDCDMDTNQGRNVLFYHGVGAVAGCLDFIANENPKRVNRGMAPYKLRVARVNDWLYFTPYIKV